MIRFILFLSLIITGCSAFGGNEAIHPQIARVVALASNKPTWNAEKSLSSKMWAVRKEINENLSVVSDPVSDRYLITRLGGPIDLVHFLALAAQTCSGKYSAEEALLIQWKAEGGEDFKTGSQQTSPPEAHPDDLPSNAFGALWGTEMRALEMDPDVDIALALHHFFEPLLPASDETAKKFSHRFIVMGLSDTAPFPLEKSRSEWFTALPLVLLSQLDPALHRKNGSSTAALRTAGFEVYWIDANPIGIRRLKRK